MAGLFGSKDPEKKKIQDMKKQLKKLVKQKDYDEALKIGEKIIQKSPNDFDVYFIVGGLYYMQKKFKTALSLFDRALGIASLDTETMLLKANCHYNLGEKKKALDTCHKIREIDQKNKAIAELIEKINSLK